MFWISILRIDLKVSIDESSYDDLKIIKKIKFKNFFVTCILGKTLLSSLIQN